MKVKFKRFSDCVRIPQKATTGSACYDLFAARCVTRESSQMPLDPQRLVWDLLYPKSKWREFILCLAFFTIDICWRRCSICQLQRQCTDDFNKSVLQKLKKLRPGIESHKYILQKRKRSSSKLVVLMKLREVVKTMDLQESKKNKKWLRLSLKSSMSAINFWRKNFNIYCQIQKQKFVATSHTVGCNDFTIFVSHDKKIFGGKIKQFIPEESDL